MTGYLCRFDPAHAAQANKRACDYWGGEMDFWGFEFTDSTTRSKLPGSWYPGNAPAEQGDPRDGFRAFAVCAVCDHWVVF